MAELQKKQEKTDISIQKTATIEQHSNKSSGQQLINFLPSSIILAEKILKVLLLAIIFY
jgi:hypothetical protein